MINRKRDGRKTWLGGAAHEKGRRYAAAALIEKPMTRRAA
jgi:hypothetical protein